MELTIKFKFKGLTFIMHDIDSDSPISFGGHYRSSSSEGESSSSSAVLMQKVFMENCRDEDSHSEPINKILQPNSYSTALSKLSSHSNPVKTEQFLRDLGLNTPKLFQSTYKLNTSGVNGNCFFASLAQQHPLIGRSALELRTIQQYILKAGMQNVYANACFPLSLVVHGEEER